MNFGLGTYSLKTKIAGHYTLTYLVMDVNMDVGDGTWLFQRARDGGAAMGGSLRSSLAGCARLPIHIAMGGYASHGRTSVPGFEVTGCW